MPFPDIKTLKQQAQGRWPDLLNQLGIPVLDNPEKHTPCPGCGGTDRFRFDNKEDDGSFICSQGTGENVAGDGFGLIQHVLNISLDQACIRVTDALGYNHQPIQAPYKPKIKSVGKRKYALELWSRAIHGHSPYHTYAIEKNLVPNLTTLIASNKKTTINMDYGARWVRDVYHRDWGRPQDCIILPIREGGTGTLLAVQCIHGEGKTLPPEKATFGTMGDGFLLLGNDLGPDNIYVVEGWADAVAVLKLGGNSCAGISFGKGRLTKVAELLLEKFPQQNIMILDDGDK